MDVGYFKVRRCSRHPMSDLETLLATLKVGVGVGFVAAVLYLVTSRSERSGFRFVPCSAREWTHYWFRTLILSVLSATLTSRSSEIGGALLALSTLLLFGSSFAFWQSDRGFCIAGLTLIAIVILLAALFPEISTARA